MITPKSRSWTAQRTGTSAALLEEYRCLYNWASESDHIVDVAQAVQDYHKAIGFRQWPGSVTDYLRRLITLANPAM